MCLCQGTREVHSPPALPCLLPLSENLLVQPIVFVHKATNNCFVPWRCIYAAYSLSVCGKSCPSQMAQKEEDTTSVPKAPAWRDCLMIFLWMTVHIQHESKEENCWCFVTFRQFASQWEKKKKKKLFTYIKCWREKKGKQKHQFVTIHICLHLNIKFNGLPLYQGHCASKLPSPHSWKHEIWKHSIWILLMVSSHKVKLIAAILRCNRWLQACFHL